jgi:hypothetical protein
VILWVAVVLSIALLALSLILLPLNPQQYTAAFSAIQASFTVIAVITAAYVFLGQREQAQAAIEVSTQQLHATELATIQDHDRRKKQATLEYVGQMNDKMRDARRYLQSWNPERRALTASQATDLRSNVSLLEPRRHVRHVFREYERLGYGCRVGIYDLEVATELTFTATTAFVRRYEQFVRVSQGNQPTAYEHALWLAEEMQRHPPASYSSSSSSSSRS